MSDLKHKALVAVATTVFLTACLGKPEQRQVTVVFRLDDYSSRSPTDTELKIIEAFRANDLPITFAVIPYVCNGDVLDPTPKGVEPLTAMKADVLRAGIRDGTLDIALHGYSHQTTSTKRRTEFAGLDYKSQVERLTKGKKFLEDITGATVSSFVPPFNQYDANTLKALDELGFSTLSAGRDGEAAEESGLNFLPASSELAELRQKVRAAAASPDKQPLILALFHPHDFVEVDKKRGSITYEGFSELLGWLKSQENVRIMSISEATTVIHDLGSKRFLLNKQNTTLFKLLPPFLRGVSLYREFTSLPAGLFIKIGGFYLVILGLGVFFARIAGRVFLNQSGFFLKLAATGASALSLVLLVYTFSDQVIGWRGVIASVGMIGISIGLGLNYLNLQRQIKTRG